MIEEISAKAQNQQEQYLSYIPKYNPYPTMLFDHKGSMLYQNNSSKQTFEHIRRLQDFNKISQLEVISLINDNASITREYFIHSHYYQLTFQGVHEISSLFVYALDITQTILTYQELEKMQKEFMFAIGTIGESRSRETGNHVKRVSEYSKLLALLAGLSEEEAEILRLASPIHDIGKVNISDKILNKPGRLTTEEFEIMKEHTTFGYSMFKEYKQSIFQTAAIIAYEHHEKYDGSGYPRGLKGEEIHIYGRITAIADVFDALGSDRIYKKAWKLDKILDLMKHESGKHFDPKLIQLFFENLPRFLEIKDTYCDMNYNESVQNSVSSHLK